MTELLAAPEPAAKPVRPLRVLQVVGTSVGGDWFHDQVIGSMSFAGSRPRSCDCCGLSAPSGPTSSTLT